MARIKCYIANHPADTVLLTPDKCSFIIADEDQSVLKTSQEVMVCKIVFNDVL